MKFRFPYLNYLFFAIAAAIIIYLLPIALEWNVKKYLENKLGARIEYKQSTWSKEGLAFNNIKIYLESEELIESLVIVDQLKIRYNLHLFDRELDFDIDIKKPGFIYKDPHHQESIEKHFFKRFEKKESASFEWIAFDEAPRYQLFFSKVHLQFIDGYLSIEDKESVHLEKIYGEATFGSKKGLQKTFTCIVGSVDNCAKLDELGTLSLQFQQFDLSAIQYLYNCFSSDSKNNWQVKKGQISGQFIWDASSLKGEGRVENLAFEHYLSGIGGFIPELEVKSLPRDEVEVYDASTLFQNSLIEATILKKASLYRFRQDLPFWLLRDIEGYIALNKVTRKGLEVDLFGQFFFSNKEEATFTLKGSLPLFKEDQEGDLFLNILSKNKSSVDAKLLLKYDTDGSKNFSLSLGQIGPREYETVRNVWPEWAFIWQEAQFIEGTLSLDLNGQLSASNQLNQLGIKRIKANNLSFKAPALSTEGIITSMEGYIDFIVKSEKKYLKPNNGHLVLQGGDFYWGSKSSYEEVDRLGRLNDVNASVTFSKGLIQEGFLKGNLGGIKGDIEYFGLSSEKVAAINLSGRADTLIDILPTLISNKFKSSLTNDTMTWKGAFLKKDAGLFLEGTFQVDNHISTSDSFLVDIDAFLERIPQEDWIDLKPKWQKWGVSLLEKEKKNLLPFQRKASTHILKLSWLKDSEGDWGISLKQGTFTLKGLQLKRWTEPFVAGNKDWGVEGNSNFYGDFNDRSLLVNYELLDFQLTTPDFKITIDELKSQESALNEYTDPTSFFYIDFEEESFYTYMPLKRASYYQKNKDLLFQSISATLSFSQHMLTLSQIETVSEEVIFKGSLTADFNPQEAFNIDIKADTVEATAEAMQKFGAHFSSSTLWLLPLQGQFVAGSKGLSLEAIVPYSNAPSQLHWFLDARLIDASLLFDELGMNMNGLNSDIYYDSKSSSLEINHLKANFFLGKDLHNPYTLIVPSFKQLEEDGKKYSLFECTVEENNQEFAYLKGGLYETDLQYKLALDPQRSHIGGIYPHLEECLWSKEAGLIDMIASIRIDLSSILTDAQKISQFPFVAEGIREKLLSFAANNKLEGIVNIDISKAEKRFTIDMKGQSVYFNDRPIEKCFMYVYGESDLIEIERLTIDAFNLQAKLEKKEKEWFISTLDFGDGAFISQGEGLYSEGRVNIGLKSYINSSSKLSILRNWASIKELIQLKGRVEVDSTLIIDFRKNSPSPLIEIQGRAFLDALEILGHKISSKESLRFNFTDSEGLNLSDIDLDLKLQNSDEAHAAFHLDGVLIDHEKEQIKLQGFKFNFNANGFDALASLAKDFFPTIIDEDTLQFLKEIKQKEGLKGIIDVNLDKDNSKLLVRLEDGNYLIFDKEYHFKNVYMSYENEKFSCGAFYQYSDLPLNLTLIIPNQEGLNGQIVVYDNKDKSSLLIDWSESDKKFVINSIKGGLAGIEADLSHKRWVQDQGQILSGYLSINNLDQLLNLLPQSLKKNIENIKIGSSCTFKGDIFFNREEVKNSTFLGRVEAKDFTLYGYDLALLTFKLSYTKDHTQITEFLITDNAVNADIKLINFIRTKNDLWHVTIPKMKWFNIRPYKLLKETKSMKTLKNLVIYDLTLLDFSGILSNSATYKARGYLTFEKVVKNTLGNVLFSIPSTLLSKLGLNLNVMIPAKGTLLFDIKDKRVYLKEFQNVYSEGEHSQFFLAKEAPSYVDFDGRLNIYIRMKQYNLLMKLTESLRLHIVGKIDDPDILFEKGSSPIR